MLVNYLFEYKDSVKFLDTTTFTSNNSRFTDNFISNGTLDLSNAVFALTSQTPTLSTSTSPISSTSLIL